MGKKIQGFGNMDKIEDLGKVSEAFLRTAKRTLGELVKRKAHSNRETHYLSNGEFSNHPGPLLAEEEVPLGEFLTGQGVKLEWLERFALGWLDRPEAMFQRLLEQSFSAELLRKSKLLADRRLAGRLIGPIQTPSGKILSFWAKRIGSQAGPEYLYWRPDWKTKVPAVWLPTALLRGGRKKGLLVVEDIWDALLLQMHGFLRTVGLGEPGQPILAKQLAQFAQLRIPSLTVALNQTSDWPSRLASLQELFQAGQWPFRLWLLPPDELGPYFSPAELVGREGPEALKKLLDSKRIAVGKLPKPLPMGGCCSSEPSKEPTPFLKEGNVSAPPAVRGQFPKICPLHGCLETDCFCFD